MLMLRCVRASFNDIRFLLPYSKERGFYRKFGVLNIPTALTSSNKIPINSRYQDLLHHITRPNNFQNRLHSNKNTGDNFDENETNFNTRNSSMKTSSLEASSLWRKDQLSKVTEKFFETGSEDQYESTKDKISEIKTREEENGPLEINCDDDVQPMWRSMERRVINKRPMTISEARSKRIPTGRRGVRRTDEEAWLEAGLYDDKVGNK